MRNATILMVVSALLVGCDMMSGTSRWAIIAELPDMEGVVEHIRRYPEIDGVQARQVKGGRPLALTGIKKADRVYRVVYSGGDCVRGLLCFTIDYREEVRYEQSLLVMNRRIPREWLAASVPIMERIERDLGKVFGVKGLVETVEVKYIFADPPGPGPRPQVAPTAHSSAR